MLRNVITPQEQQPELAKILGLKNGLFFKREDLHPYGSHKGRSVPLMIERYAEDKGARNFIISSSGNAALAALRYIEARNKNKKDSGKFNLRIYVGRKINKKKLAFLIKESGDSRDPNITIHQTERPKQEAIGIAKNTGAVLLRQSTDDLALIGYKSLAEELKEIRNLQAVFIPASSGTTTQALGKNLWGAQIHIVQTNSCHPIAGIFDKDSASSETSLADAVVDKVALRKNQVIDLIKKSKGFGWVISDKEIKEAVELVKKYCAGLEISPNSALAIAGLKKALNKGWIFNRSVVCLITGR